MTKLNGIRKIGRKCLVCEKSIKVTLYKDDYYRGGHFFNKIRFPIKGTGEYKKVGRTKLGKMKIDVVKWTGKEEEVEYWECSECYDKALHEGWLEETLEKLFGERCKDYAKDCACCEAWDVCDTIIDPHRIR